MKQKLGPVSSVLEVVSNMTREELRRVAKAANIPRGKNKDNMVNSLMDAISNGKVGYKIFLTLNLPLKKGQQFRSMIATKIFRSYQLEKIKLEPRPILVPVAHGD